MKKLYNEIDSLKQAQDASQSELHQKHVEEKEEAAAKILEFETQIGQLKEEHDAALAAQSENHKAESEAVKAEHLQAIEAETALKAALTLNL